MGNNASRDRKIEQLKASVASNGLTELKPFFASNDNEQLYVALKFLSEVHNLKVSPIPRDLALAWAPKIVDLARNAPEEAMQFYALKVLNSLQGDNTKYLVEHNVVRVLCELISNYSSSKPVARAPSSSPASAFVSSSSSSGLSVVSDQEREEFKHQFIQYCCVILHSIVTYVSSSVLKLHTDPKALQNGLFFCSLDTKDELDKIYILVALSAFCLHVAPSLEKFVMPLIAQAPTVLSAVDTESQIYVPFNFESVMKVIKGTVHPPIQIVCLWGAIVPFQRYSEKELTSISKHLKDIKNDPRIQGIPNWFFILRRMKNLLSKRNVNLPKASPSASQPSSSPLMSSPSDDAPLSTSLEMERAAHEIAEGAIKERMQELAMFGFEESIIEECSSRLLALVMGSAPNFGLLHNLDFILETANTIQSEGGVVVDCEKMIKNFLDRLSTLSVVLPGVPQAPDVGDASMSHRVEKLTRRFNKRRAPMMVAMLSNEGMMFIERGNVLHSFLDQITDFDISLLIQGRVKIIFFDKEVGEPEAGVDLGGLLKEALFFFSEELKMWDSSNNIHNLPDDTFKRYKRSIVSFKDVNLRGFPTQLSCPKFYKGYGRILGTCLRYNIQVEFPLSLVLCKVILGQPITFEDLEILSPNMVQRTIRPTLLSDDIESWDLYFDRNIGSFMVSLKEGGENEQVVEANKVEYLELLVKDCLGSNCIETLKAFVEGFRDIVPAKMLDFTAEELHALIVGTELNVSDWKAHCKSNNPGHPVFKWFWELMEEASPEECLEVFSFSTSLRCFPVCGAGSLTHPFVLEINDDLESENLPTACTCFNKLTMPAYESKEKLKAKLMVAVQERGFHTR